MMLVAHQQAGVAFEGLQLERHWEPLRVRLFVWILMNHVLKRNLLMLHTTFLLQLVAKKPMHPAHEKCAQPLVDHFGRHVQTHQYLQCQDPQCVLQVAQDQKSMCVPRQHAIIIAKQCGLGEPTQKVIPGHKDFMRDSFHMRGRKIDHQLHRLQHGTILVVNSSVRHRMWEETRACLAYSVSNQG